MLEFPAPFRVHEFTAKGQHVLFDVESLSFFETDNATAQVVKLGAQHNRGEIVSRLSAEYAPDQIQAALQRVESLVTEGKLTVQHPQDPHADYLRTTPPPSTQSLVLDLVYGCNMQCDYCFGGPTASYSSQPGFMDIKVAHQAVDFLMCDSRPEMPVHVFLFGGEPCLNWQGIAETVRYSREQAALHGRHVSFTLFTNGTLLNPERIQFLCDNDISIMYSLDGPQEVNDKIRRLKNGGGVYDLAKENLVQLLQTYHKAPAHSQVMPPTIMVRATVTHAALNLTELAHHFADIGVEYLWFKPVTLREQHPLAIQKQDVPVLEEEYDRLADMFLDKAIAGESFVISTFLNKMLRLSRRNRRVRCIVGKYILGISRFGEIYPCHRFVGHKKFYLGNVDHGIDGGRENPVWKRFLDYSVDCMPACKDCWARYVCGGNCVDDNQLYERDLYTPQSLRCHLLKRETELVVALSLILQAKNPAALARLVNRYDSHGMQLMR